MVLVWPILCLGVVVGFGLAMWAWRGKLLDDHPYCRKCHYDLFGLKAEAATCPECGADIRTGGTVRMGRRKRQWGVVTAGAAVCLSFGTILYIDEYRPWNLDPFLPRFLLRLDLRIGGEYRFDIAKSELSRRIFYDLNAEEIRLCLDWLIDVIPPDDYEIPESQAMDFWDEILPLACIRFTSQIQDGEHVEPLPSPLMDLMLEIQANAKDHWVGNYGDYIEALERIGRLDDQSWQRYLRQGTVIFFQSRLQIGDGEPIVWHVEPKIYLGNSAEYDVEVTCESIRIDERVLDGLEYLEQGSIDTRGRFRGRTVSNMRFTVNRPYTLVPGQIVRSWALEPGQHKIDVGFRIRVWRDRARQNLLTEQLESVSGLVHVLPAGQSSVKLHHLDEPRRQFIDQHGAWIRAWFLPRDNSESPGEIILEVLDRRNSNGSLENRLGPKYLYLPHDINLVADLYLQMGDNVPLPQGDVMFLRTDPFNYDGSGFRINIPYAGPLPGSGDRIRVILRPNPKRASRTLHAYHIFDEIIIDQTYLPSDQD